MKHIPIDLNEKAREIYWQNKSVGWWDDPDRCIYTTLQLVNTEIAEATEGERKGINDDHLPNRKMGEVELADALIRVLDIVGRADVYLSRSVISRAVSLSFLTDAISGNVYQAHLTCTAAVCSLAECIDTESPYTFVGDAVQAVQLVIACLIATAYQYEYDIFGAMEEKLAYNKTRADHKREARAAEGGKKV